MKDWKQAERRIAAEIGGRRVPVSGRQRGDVPDVAHDSLSVEVKSRQRLPQWLEDAMRQAEAAAADGQLPVTVLHEDRGRYTEALVVMRIKDFTKLIEKGD